MVRFPRVRAWLEQLLHTHDTAQRTAAESVVLEQKATAVEHAIAVALRAVFECIFTFLDRPALWVDESATFRRVSETPVNMVLEAKA